MNSTFLFNDEIQDLVSRIKTCLTTISTNPKNSNASDLDSVSSNPRNNRLIDAKLSKIQIPKFNGKPIKWQNFGISFLQLFIVKHIPDVVKFSYLKGF